MRIKRLSNRQSPIKRRRAAAAIELAILLPLLITLCLVTVDLGRACQCGIALASAARVGAEYGATRRFDVATAGVFKDRVAAAARDEFSSQSGLDPAAMLVQCEVTTAANGLHTCDVTVEYQFQTVVHWPTIPNPLILRREARFRRFR
jgi:Flp pilus assembly protein TadG